MRYLAVEEIIALHRVVVADAESRLEIRDRGALESAAAQPSMGFGATEAYPTLAAKAAALCYSLVRNHSFVDGNKRIDHAATEFFLIENGWELCASVDEEERVILALAAGELAREQLTEWIASHLRPSSVQ
ncbi:MAG TPA: type II toxin-antitoxin system death-on-curing family toxin [Pirellulaceae bacterium]|jgi:death-on-curing protein|nr:type II toxin-antitoxin system death-on-curing family toxin [Pirellulaceae bacterium]